MPKASPIIFININNPKTYKSMNKISIIRFKYDHLRNEPFINELNAVSERYKNQFAQASGRKTKAEKS
jgi:hypothetical protein